jgi:hypothetical protein
VAAGPPPILPTASTASSTTGSIFSVSSGIGAAGSFRDRVGDEVLCKCVKDGLYYPAHILEVQEVEGGESMLVHYRGWGHNYDEWVTCDRIQADRKATAAASAGANAASSSAAFRAPRSKTWRPVLDRTAAAPAAAPPPRLSSRTSMNPPPPPARPAAQPRPAPAAGRPAAPPPLFPRPKKALAAGKGPAPTGLQALLRARDLDTFLRGLWAITCYQCGGPGQIGPGGGGERRLDETVSCSRCIRTYHLECTGPGSSAAINLRRGRPQPSPAAAAAAAGGRGGEWVCRLCLQGEETARRHGPLGAPEDLRRIIRLAESFPERHVLGAAARTLQRWAWGGTGPGGGGGRG